MLKSPHLPPKRLDPALWIKARAEWESSPDVTYTDIAARLGVAVPSVTMRAKREFWVKGNILDLARIDVTPMEMVATAVRALMRAAQQSKDLPTAVKAAGMLLDRAMGRVVVEQTTPLLTPALPEPQEPFPDGMTPEQWLNRFARDAQTPDPALPPAEALIASPAASEPPARLHIVQAVASVPPPAEPKFWASPTVPRADN